MGIGARDEPPLFETFYGAFVRGRSRVMGSFQLSPIESLFGKRNRKNFEKLMDFDFDLYRGNIDRFGGIVFA